MPKLKIVSRGLILQGEYLNVWETTFLDGNDKEGVWRWVERIAQPVAIFPIVEDRIVLVKNYRIPLERYVIEMPAGLQDSGETDEQTAYRELMEETGYRAHQLTPVQAWPYRSGTSNGYFNGFIATGLTKINNCSGDASEDIEVIEVPAKELLPFYHSFTNNPEVVFDNTILALYLIAKDLKFIQ